LIKQIDAIALQEKKLLAKTQNHCKTRQGRLSEKRESRKLAKFYYLKSLREDYVGECQTFTWYSRRSQLVNQQALPSPATPMLVIPTNKSGKSSLEQLSSS